MANQRGRPPHPGAITPAEERVLELVKRDMPNAEIAVRLGISVNTVRYHVANLLAKAGVATRADLMDWQPGEAPRTSPRRWWAGFGLVRWAGVGAAGVAVVGGAVVLAMVLAGQSDEPAVDGTDAVATASQAPDADASQSAAADGFVAPPVIENDREGAVPTFALVAWDGPETSVELRDASTGARIASVPAGYRPTATFRRSAGELLVVESPRTGDGLGEAVIDVLDATNGLALKRSMPAPEAMLFTVYFGYAQGLSADERFFAVATQGRIGTAECVDSNDGPACALYGVRIYDLVDADARPWWFELPGCGVPTFLPEGDTGFLASCADGPALSLVNTGTAGSPVFSAKPAEYATRGSAYAYLTSASSGWVGWLSYSGFFGWTKAGLPARSARALPDGMFARWPLFAETEDGRLVAGFVSQEADQYPDGLAIFDLRTGEVERTLPGFDISRTMVATGDDALFAMTRGGDLVRVDLASGASQVVEHHPANPEEIALVR